MTVGEQLIAEIGVMATPEKARMLKMRALIGELARGCPDTETAKAIERRLNGVYLVLQLATASDHETATRAYRSEFVALVRVLERSGGSATTSSARASSRANPNPRP